VSELEQSKTSPLLNLPGFAKTVLMVELLLHREITKATLMPANSPQQLAFLTKVPFLLFYSLVLSFLSYPLVVSFSLFSLHLYRTFSKSREGFLPATT
jgi:hypothetical protein